MALSYVPYRIKIDNITDITTKVVVKSQVGYTDTALCTKTIVPLPYCYGKNLLIKYLDNNGEYKFYVFSRYYEETMEVEQGGETINIYTNIATSNGNTRQLKSNVTHKIKAVAECVSNEIMNNLRDISYSSRVYVRMKENDSPNNSAWILVKCKADTTVLNTKHNFMDFNCEFTLPQYYTI